MNTISFTRPVSFHAGRIRLTDKQAAVRMRYLDPLGDGLFEIKGSVEFKAGEKIGLEEIPKSYRHLLSPESEKMLEDIEREKTTAEVREELKAEAKAEAEEAARKEAEAKKEAKTGAEKAAEKSLGDKEGAGKPASKGNK